MMIILVHLNHIFRPALRGVTRYTMTRGGRISYSIGRVLIIQKKEHMVWIFFFFFPVLINIIPAIK